MASTRDGHLTDEQIESYSMGRLPEEQSAPIEEHLLICETCRARVADMDAYIAAIRRAAEQLPQGDSNRENAKIRAASTSPE